MFGQPACNGCILDTRSMLPFRQPDIQPWRFGLVITIGTCKSIAIIAWKLLISRKDGQLLTLRNMTTCLQLGKLYGTDWEGLGNY